MKSLFSMLAVMWLAVFAVPAGAQDLTFRGCTDAAGRAVPSRLDVESPSLVMTQMGKSRPLIVYNPRALPDVTDAVRAFLYAHECARHSLGITRDVPTAEAAHRADCEGLATLQRSGMLVEAGDVTALQSMLVFSPEQWARVPGPPRGFDLNSCPTRRAMPQSDPAWNQCVHRCGDRLFHCGQSASCLATYNSCQSACRR
ncbi:hypothetical protein [Denitromonas ohlonensis]|uniref:Uncharacterized protein n=2 Tax=Denitromonas TaxID=139331 RepID=A0A557RR26_9RHOO|nr:hypothetical protein [Denitromonas ohlonensis]TVO67619.1 hypothetical protein FHP90_06570 [Denitromonas ohlonensis]TVO76477.1 hypothetical protein FHP89_10265 [Denitromonas ohlonensis]